MNEVLTHFLNVGPYTYAGAYKSYYNSLPDDVEALGTLICSQVIHRVTLREGNEKANHTLIYGDMNRFPWYRLRCEDDVFLTAPSMTAELFRLDERGFTTDRQVENKLVLTCRYVSVLMSSILKAKGIPCRSRSGFAPYFFQGESWDHWINQYWNEKEKRWVTFDADGFYDKCNMGLGQFDIAQDRFDWAANTWLSIRNGAEDGQKFVYADREGTRSLKAAVRAVFYDFHAFMNHEISYRFQPAYLDGKFDKLSEVDLKEIDALAELMLDPDKNLDKLKTVWNTCKKFRVLNSPLVGDFDNIPEKAV